jgi:hypothetical protein
VSKLFELIEEELPVGQKGWKVVVKEFNKWAKKHGRPKRVGNALENKYKQVCACPLSLVLRTIDPISVS